MDGIPIVPSVSFASPAPASERHHLLLISCTWKKCLSLFGKTFENSFKLPRYYSKFVGTQKFSTIWCNLALHTNRFVHFFFENQQLAQKLKYSFSRKLAALPKSADIPWKVRTNKIYSVNPFEQILSIFCPCCQWICPGLISHCEILPHEDAVLHMKLVANSVRFVHAICPLFLIV